LEDQEVMLPPNILRYNPIKQPKSKCGPFDCKVLDRNGLMKYIVTGEEQSRTNGFINHQYLTKGDPSFYKDIKHEDWLWMSIKTYTD
jgi:hypothetical protein